MSHTILKQLAYYRTGGTADAVVEPHTIQDLAAIIKRLHTEREPYFVLGGGTNSLVWDDHFPGTVIIMRRLNRITVDGNRVYAEAGVDNSELAATCLQHQLAGCAWMYRLPGQLGGTVRMNARCYGGEISQIVESVIAITPEGDIVTHENRGIFRGYKDTIFMDNGMVVAAAWLRLVVGDPVQIKSVMEHCESDRNRKSQFAFPSCGCVFKNNYDVGVPSGLLLESAGVKAYDNDRLGINPHHANFVFNKNATSREILELTFQMREAVYLKFGVWLEYEMEILGQLPPDLKARIQMRKPEHWDEEALTVLRDQFKTKSSAN